MKTKLASALIMALTLALVLTIAPAMAYFNSVSFNGQGIAANGVLQTQLCGVTNGADITGPYLFWTLSAPDARNAEISGPWGNAIMNRDGNGIFTYTSGWYDQADLAMHPIKATYDGRPGAATLEISHGCEPAR